MNVSLSEYWEKFIAQQIASGQYGNASEIIREALRHWRDERERKAMDDFRAAWPQQGPTGEPAAEDEARIAALIRDHRRQKKSKP